LGLEDEHQQEVNYTTRKGEDIQQRPSNPWPDYFPVSSDLELDSLGGKANCETNATFRGCPVGSDMWQFELAQVDPFQIDIDPEFPNRLKRLNARHVNLNRINRTLTTMVKNLYPLSSSEEGSEDWLDVIHIQGFERNEIEAW